MKLAVVGHSLIHVRQVSFFKELARLGHDVLLLPPGEWGEQRARSVSTQPEGKGTFTIRTLRHFGGEDSYRFQFSGLRDALRDLSPDVLYVQQEPGSLVAAEAAEYDVKKALFTWENLSSNYTPYANQVLSKYDLVVCGNNDAESLVRESNKNTVVLPQVGVDTVHFQSRETILRDIAVAYIGRQVEVKGVDKLLLAWPTTRVLKWQPYERLPWWYSQCQIVVCFSQDTDRWREQAMPYVAVEAMCCGCAVVVSDAGSIPFWLLGGFADPCPNVAIVPQDQLGMLRNSIGHFLSLTPECRLAAHLESRQWVEKYLGSKVIAERLTECLATL